MMPTFLAPLVAAVHGLGRKPSSGRYQPELDGLRCFAILIVMVWHASLKIMRFTADSGFTESIDNPRVAWVPDGAVGVQLFFFLSGFVICRPFLAPLRQPLGAFVLGFYRNRLIRIVPPYALVLIGSYLVIKVFGFAPERAATFELLKTDLTTSLLASLFYVHGLMGFGPPKLNPPGWSLEIEIQFYLLAPALILAYLALRDRARRLVLGFGIVVASVVLRVWLVEVYGAYGYFRWTLLNYFAVFMLGIVMADLAQGAPQASPRQRGTAFDLLGVLSALVLLAAGLPRHPEGWAQYGALDAAMLLSIVGLYYGATGGRRFNRLLSLRALTVTGAACYAIYLTHVLLMHFAAGALFKLVRLGSFGLDWLLGMLVLMPVALLGGFVFHLTVERFFIRLAANRPARAAAVAAAARS